MLDPTTREKYTYYLGAHILPVLGPIRMADIFPEHIREWITLMQREGRSAWTIQYCKTSILSSIFTTALNDQVTYIHPCRDVKIPTVPATVRTIVTPEQVRCGLCGAARYRCSAPGRDRHRERPSLGVAEPRVRDLDMTTRMLTVSRKVTEVARAFHPDGTHFLVKLYPKDKEYRRLKLSQQIVAKLKAHIEAHGLDPDGLLFARRAAAPAQPCLITEPGTLDFTEPNTAGRRYRHGTLSAYNAGPCRCAYCRRAFGDYRAKRRGAGRLPAAAARDRRRRAHRAQLVPADGLAPGV